ncbi:MAG: signal transduction histidine kinase, partial [Cyclobacteriaceae bacterium]
RLLQLQGSDISVKSEIGKGSEFSFVVVLPIGEKQKSVKIQN